MGHHSIRVTVDTYGHLVQAGTKPQSVASTSRRRSVLRDSFSRLPPCLTTVVEIPQRTGVRDDRVLATIPWRIRAAVKRLGEEHPELGRHLQNAVRTGTWCAYRPETAVVWRIETGG